MIGVMVKKKVAYKPAPARPDMHSKKRSGILRMSLRVNIDEARLIRKAAKQKRMSAHYWMLTNLLDLARIQLNETIT